MSGWCSEAAHEDGIDYRCALLDAHAGAHFLVYAGALEHFRAIYGQRDAPDPAADQHYAGQARIAELEERLARIAELLAVACEDVALEDVHIAACLARGEDPA